MASTQPKNLAEVGLFTGIPQLENFPNMGAIMPTRKMTPSSSPKPWTFGEEAALPTSFEFAGEKLSVEEFLDSTDTAALLVIRDGKIVYESYSRTGKLDQPWMSFSVAKSFTSTLVGIAIEEGHIGSVHDPISNYVPLTPGSAFDGVTIETALHMASGARWLEDYSDPESDVSRLLAATDEEGDGLDGFISRMKKEFEANSMCRYNSGETQVLGALVAHATGRSLTEYMKEKLVEPLGFEHESYWVTDRNGIEMSYGGVNCTARDYARLGQLFLDQGSVGETQVISKEWVEKATRIDSPLRSVGEPIVGGHKIQLGYGYQWWILGEKRADFAALGVYNQGIYVDPSTRTVIVRLAALQTFGTSELEEDNRDETTAAFFRAVADSVAKP